MWSPLIALFPWFGSVLSTDPAPGSVLVTDPMVRRSTIEVHPNVREAPHLRSSIHTSPEN